MMCTLYGVTRGGFYAWQAREPSARSLGDAELTQRVARVHRNSRGLYGSPRVVRKLRQQGVNVGQRKVARLMRLARFAGAQCQAVPSITGEAARVLREHRQQPACAHAASHGSDLGSRCDLSARRRPMALSGCGDGQALAPHHRLEPEPAARRGAHAEGVRHAVSHRQPAPGCVFHTDRGIEYAAFDMREELKRHGLVQSMNRPGRMNDNAHMESFFHSMKTEALYGLTFDTDNALRSEVFVVEHLQASLLPGHAALQQLGLNLSGGFKLYRVYPRFPGRGDVFGNIVREEALLRRALRPRNGFLVNSARGLHRAHLEGQYVVVKCFSSG